MVGPCSCSTRIVVARTASPAKSRAGRTRSRVESGVGATLALGRGITTSGGPYRGVVVATTVAPSTGSGTPITSSITPVGIRYTVRGTADVVASGRSGGPSMGRAGALNAHISPTGTGPRRTHAVRLIPGAGRPGTGRGTPSGAGTGRIITRSAIVLRLTLGGWATTYSGSGGRPSSTGRRRAAVVCPDTGSGTLAGTALAA